MYQKLTRGQNESLYSTIWEIVRTNYTDLISGFCWKKKIMIFVMNEGYFPLDNGNKFEFYVFEFDDLLREGFLLSLLIGFDFCFEKKIWIKLAL